LQVLHTDSKYNKDKILKYLICEHYLLNNADSFRIFLRIQHIHCSLGISLIVPQFCQNTFFFTINFISPLSSYAHKLLTYFSVLKPCEMTTFYRHFSVSPLNSLIFCFLNVLILRVSRLHKLSKLPYTTINFTVISVLQSSVKSIGKCKKKNPCIINQNNIFLGFIYSLCCYE
jgi:hypothetical protein